MSHKSLSLFQKPFSKGWYIDGMDPKSKIDVKSGTLSVGAPVN